MIGISLLSDLNNNKDKYKDPKEFELVKTGIIEIIQTKEALAEELHKKTTGGDTEPISDDIKPNPNPNQDNPVRNEQQKSEPNKVTTITPGACSPVTEDRVIVASFSVIPPFKVVLKALTVATFQNLADIILGLPGLKNTKKATIKLNVVANCTCCAF